LQLTASYKSSVTTRSMTTGVTPITLTGTSGHLRATLVGTELTCIVDETSPQFDPVSVSLTLDGPAVPGTAGAYARNSVLLLESMFITGVP
jgi:hypothetical protein